MSNFVRSELADGVVFNTVRDSRFKTMEIEANIIVPLSAQTASANAVLAFVLSRSCKEYPTYRQLCKKLSALYGAELSVNVTKAGDRQVLTLSARGLDDRYALDGESIAEQLSLLLCKVIFEPNIIDEKFPEDEVEQCRRQMLDLIDSEFNDKRIYAIGQMVGAMCEDEIYGIKRYGTAEEVKAVTSQKLYAAWQSLLKNAAFQIIYVGDSAPDKAISVFTEAFRGVERTPQSITTQVVSSADSVKRVTEEMEVSQSKLVMGFRTDCALPEDVTAARLMCAVLGGTANSKLFCNVREKQSLCYYCASRFDKHKGLMLIDSGVEGDNVEKLEAGILKEIEDMKNGIISDFELESTKLAVINSYYSTNDTTGGITAWYSSQIFDGAIRSIEEMAQLVNAVTKDDIVRAANKLTLDTVYVLKNK